MIAIEQLQSLKSDLEELQKANSKIRKEIKRIYGILEDIQLEATDTTEYLNAALDAFQTLEDIVTALNQRDLDG